MCDLGSYWRPYNTYPGVSTPYYPHHQAMVVQHPPPQMDVATAYYAATYDYSYTPSSSRQQRNEAEKQRRNKLNHFIGQLSQLVPMVSSSGKKLDKTSILRLSATFLRIHQFLMVETKGESMKDLSMPMCQFLRTVFDEIDGMFLMVTSSGKIVFITHNVERYLGHHQNDLFGSCLSDITHPDDIPELMRNLKPDDDDYIRIDDSRRERRSFFLRLKHKATSRSDQPQYEMVHIEGHLRLPRNQQIQSRSNTHTFERYLRAHLSVNNGALTEGDNGPNSNDIVLVAIVKPYKEKWGLSGQTLLDANKEEWFTRHLLDGTIVFADHRVSVLSGYMSEELSGSSAFHFIHKDDVQWVLVALKEMFTKGEPRGWSAYRLESKNGEFIYLRTEGFLEPNEGTQVVKSFICLNKLLLPSEGEAQIAEMKRRFKPLINRSPEAIAASPESSNSSTTLRSPRKAEMSPEAMLKTEEPQQLNLNIDLLLSDLNNVTSQIPPPEEQDQDYTKVEMVSKSLPPVEEQTKKIDAKLRCNRPSVITSITNSSERHKRPPENIENTEVKRPRPEIRSVIVSEMRSVIKRHEPEAYELDTTYNIYSELINTSGNHTFSNISDDESLRLPEEANSSELWDSSVSDIEDGVLKGHLHLENRLQSQEEVPMPEITELQTFPLSDYRNHITHLKADHRKQGMLKSLQHEHKSIHIK